MTISTMVYPSQIEQKMVEQGYDNLSLPDKNLLLTTLGGRGGMLLSDVTPTYVLQQHQNLKVELFSDTCENKIIEGFTSSSTNHIFRLNRDDQLNMMGKRDQIKEDSTITSVNWLTLDAGYQSFTAAQFLTVYSEALTYKENVILQYNQYKGQILAATTHAAIFAIQWT